jgi:flagellar protein FliJ
MSDLSSLIRLHKHELDEKRLALAALYEEAARLERQRRTLERAFEAEKEAIARLGDIPFTFASYAESVAQKREKMAEEAAMLEKKIASAKEGMMETFSELKKYEMTQEKRARNEEQQQLSRESRELDEIGIEGFRRRSVEKE